MGEDGRLLKLGAAMTVGSASRTRLGRVLTRQTIRLVGGAQVSSLEGVLPYHCRHGLDVFLSAFEVVKQVESRRRDETGASRSGCGLRRVEGRVDGAVAAVATMKVEVREEKMQIRG